MNQELIPFSEASLQGVDWETLNSLAYKFQGRDPNPTAPPTQLADARMFADVTAGIPAREVAAMKEAEVGPWEKEGQPAPAPIKGYNPGKDDKVIKDWRDAYQNSPENKARQQKEFERLMQERKKQKY